VSTSIFTIECDVTAEIGFLIQGSQKLVDCLLSACLSGSEYAADVEIV
jgi:hypothetical protein